VTPELIAPEKLTPHPRNSRVHSPEQITALGRAIREWGFLQPVVADEHFTILIGHGRVEAAKSIGLTEIPVVILKGLSETKKRALLISDNRLAELGASWDQGVLGDELRYLLGEDFDITLTAFELPEVPELDADPEGEAFPKPAVVQRGDIWRLGAHYLACTSPANAGVTAALEGLLHPSLMVSAIFDPDTPQEALSEPLAAMPGSVDVAYLWHHPRLAAPAALALDDAGFDIRSQIIRERDRPGHGHRYGMQHDPGWYAVRRGSTAKYAGGRTQSTLWRLGPFRHGLPVDCWKRPIQNHLKAGSGVFDPWAGSGSVFIAAHQTARVACGIEFDAVACDAIIQRWQAFTGLEAQHGYTGETYDQVQAGLRSGNAGEVEGKAARGKRGKAETAEQSDTA